MKHPDLYDGRFGQISNVLEDVASKTFSQDHLPITQTDHPHVDRSAAMLLTRIGV